MATPGTLRNPPIQEALVDIRVVSNTAVTPDVLRPIQEQLFDRYPQFETRHQMRAEVQPKGVISTKDLGFHGYFAKDTTGSKVAQFRQDGFTLSQLTNYTTADDLFNEALELWQRYVRLATPQVVRLAVRYINRLPLPFRPGDEFSKFLTAPIEMPTGTPQAVESFLTRAVTKFEEPSEATAIVTQQLEGTLAASTFILDLDVVKAAELPSDSHALRGILQDLRVMKNRLFFAFLTDEALEPYR